MKKEQSRLWLFLLLLVVPVSARAQQAWSGIISPSRAINWSNAGVIGGIPDASWAQCGSTIQAYGTSGAPGSASTINNAISACGTNQYVQLGAGTFYLNSSINFGGKSNVVLRGVGADQTIILFTSGPGSGCQGLGGGVCIINGDAQDARSGLPNTANWTAGYVPGTTSITLSSTANLSVGALLILWQADQPSDPGTIWNCQNTGSLGTCSQQGGQGGAVRKQSNANSDSYVCFGQHGWNQPGTILSDLVCGLFAACRMADSSACNKRRRGKSDVGQHSGNG